MSWNALRCPTPYRSACTVQTAPNGLSERAASVRYWFLCLYTLLAVMIRPGGCWICPHTSLPPTAQQDEASWSGVMGTTGFPPSLCYPSIVHWQGFRFANTLTMGQQWPHNTFLHGFTEQSCAMHAKGVSGLLFLQLHPTCVLQVMSFRFARWGRARGQLTAFGTALPNVTCRKRRWSFFSVPKPKFTHSEHYANLQMCHEFESQPSDDAHACLDVMEDAICSWSVNKSLNCLRASNCSQIKRWTALLTRQPTCTFEQCLQYDVTAPSGKVLATDAAFLFHD